MPLSSLCTNQARTVRGVGGGLGGAIDCGRRRRRGVINNGRWGEEGKRKQLSAGGGKHIK